MNKRNSKVVESKEKSEFIEMALDEIDKLNDDIKKFAKDKGFDASFVYDDDATYLSIYATDKTVQSEQWTLPKEAVELIGKICKGSGSDLVIQDGDSCIDGKKDTVCLWFSKSPMCANNEDSYANICDYCDYIRKFLK